MEKYWLSHLQDVLHLVNVLHVATYGENESTTTQEKLDERKRKVITDIDKLLHFLKQKRAEVAALKMVDVEAETANE